MVVPDIELIAEIMMVAEGFQDARLLARKFITLYNLCQELLSKQDHYDWGLRAVKSVLVVAGTLKRGDPGRDEDQVTTGRGDPGRGDPGRDEDQVTSDPGRDEGQVTSDQLYQNLFSVRHYYCSNTT